MPKAVKPSLPRPLCQSSSVALFSLLQDKDSWPSFKSRLSPAATLFWTVVLSREQFWTLVQAMSGAVFGCYSWEDGDCPWHLVCGGKPASRYPRFTGQPQYRVVQLQVPGVPGHNPVLAHSAPFTASLTQTHPSTTYPT